MAGARKGRQGELRSSGWGSRMGLGLAVGGVAALLSRDLGLPTLISYPHDYLPLTLLLVPLGVAAWGCRLKPVFASVTALLALVWCTVAFTPLSSWMIGDLARADPLEECDVVFVLSSGLQSDGEPTATALSRLSRGLELLAQGLAPRLVLTELRPPAASYAAYAKTTMERLGLTQELLTVGPVGNTRDEVVALDGLCRRRGWTRVLLVTSPYHSRRGAAALENEGLTVVASPAIETRFDLQTLDRPSDRLQAFSALLHEHVGIWVYRRRGWIGARRSRAPGS